MKNLSFLITTIFLISFHANAQDTYTAEAFEIDSPTSTATTSLLTVKITGLDSDEGTVKIGVYDSEGTWLSQSKYRQTTDIENGTATVVFKNIPQGTYGISTYHDENSNSKLDKNFLGIPSEPYASSRGAKGRFGPPKWKNAKFEFIASTQTELIKF